MLGFFWPKRDVKYPILGMLVKHIKKTGEVGHTASEFIVSTIDSIIGNATENQLYEVKLPYLD